MATKCNKKSKSNGFVEPMYFNYYPYLQLCIAYYNLNDIEKSKSYNIKADKYFSTEITKNNIKFFNSIEQKKTH